MADYNESLLICGNSNGTLANIHENMTKELEFIHEEMKSSESFDGRVVWIMKGMG